MRMRHARDAVKKTDRPRPGCVDENARFDLARCAVGAAQLRRPGLRAALCRFAACARRDFGAALLRVERIEHDEARIVAPGVGIDEARIELRLQRAAGNVVAQLGAARMRKRVRAALAEAVVHHQAGADHPRGPQMRLVRQYEAQRFDVVRRRIENDVALGQGFGDERDFVLFEIAQAAVDQLAACAGRVRSEIVLLDEQHRQAASGCIARDRRAVDAAADDEYVDLIVRLCAHLRIFADSRRRENRAPSGNGFA